MTATCGTMPSAGRKVRAMSPGMRARINVHAPSAIAPADEPARAAPAHQASRIDSHTGVAARVAGTSPGSPPTR